MNIQTYNGTVSITAGREVVDISYLEIIAGNADEAVPVIVCHGFMSSKEMLAGTFLKHLIKEAMSVNLNLHILAFDWPGHGLSGELKNHSFKNLREVLCGFMDEMNIVRAHIFGMSMGGVIGIMFAAKHPGRVMTLCPVGAPIDSRDLDFKPGFRQAAAVVKFLRFLNRVMPCKMTFLSEDVVKKLAPVAALSGPPKRVKDFETAFEDRYIHASIIRDIRRFSMRACLAYTNEFLRIYLFNEIKAIRDNPAGQIPVLVIDGEDPWHRFLDTAKRIIARLNPEFTEKSIIEDVGHLSVILKPEKGAKCYIEFLLKTHGVWNKANLRLM